MASNTFYVNTKTAEVVLTSRKQKLVLATT